MAKVTYTPGIQFASGALVKPKKINGHKHGNYLITTHRVAATTNPECTRIYVRSADAYVRSTPVTSDERAARNRFAAISRAVSARKKDLSKVASDLAAFNAQKDDPDGYKTMRQYLWHICADEIDG